MEMERGSGWGMYGSGWGQTGQGGEIWPAAGHTREMRVHSLLAPVARGQHLSECAVAPSSAHNQPRGPGSPAGTGAVPVPGDM